MMVNRVLMKENSSEKGKQVLRKEMIMLTHQ
jgi:hypothetical protein